jgi:hypothetical protein
MEGIPFSMEVLSQPNQGCERGKLKMMPLYFKEGTLFGSHWNRSLGECPFLVHDQWEYPHPKIYHATSGTKIECESIVPKNMRASLKVKFLMVRLNLDSWSNLTCLG